MRKNVGVEFNDSLVYLKALRRIWQKSGATMKRLMGGRERFVKEIEETEEVKCSAMQCSGKEKEEPRKPKGQRENVRLPK